jgi:hypothetical protein
MAEQTPQLFDLNSKNDVPDKIEDSPDQMQAVEEDSLLYS